ncbi:MAG: cyclic pyranopterin monophosphate synthase MoaC [Candidatus Eisenbacteria sp.]|nr:cyclic pyranopterin monophosphate synthase MoaC [Candidatus Eisenbacteria bacterium]
MGKLTHLDEEGRAKMVDVGAKEATSRHAVARGKVLLSPETLTLLSEKRLRKGHPVEVARIAGIMAAKRCAELIPLCHPLSLTHVDVSAEITDGGVDIEASVRTVGSTGVEMEALTAVSVAALTIYDMCKAVEKGIVISDIRLMRKEGGRSGVYTRKE